jgi:hypothetical protein
MHSDPRGMFVCMHENWGPYGEFWGVGGVGGRAMAEHTIDHRKRSAFQHM